MIPNLRVITGLDGSGKTLQSELLIKKFPEYKHLWARYKPFLLKIPINYFNKKNLKKNKVDKETYDQFSETKKGLFRSRILREAYLFFSFLDYYSQIILFVGWRILLKQKILLDRYFYDYLVDISISFGLNQTEIKELCKRRYFTLFPKPDKAYLLDLDPKISLERKDDPNIPNEEYLFERRKKYLLIAKIYNLKVIDATKEIEKVQEKIVEDFQ